MINQLIKSMLPLIVSSGLLALTLSVLPRPSSAFTTSHSLDPLTTNSTSPAQDRTALAQPNSHGITTWTDPCTNRRMEIQGVGLGDSITPLSPQRLSLSDPDQIDWLLAQVAGRKDNDPAEVLATVTLTTDAPRQIHLDQPISQTNYSYIFETLLTPTGQITAAVSNPGDSYKTPRGFILYSKRETDERWTSVGKTLNQYVYWQNEGADPETLTFDPLTQATTLSVTAVVIDNNIEGPDEAPRILELEVKTENTPPHIITQASATDGPLLSIIEVTLPNVPLNTDHVDITLRSPSGNGDSLVLAGVNVSYRCAEIVPDPVNSELILTKTVDNPNPNAAEIIQYTIKVTNTGSATVTDLQILDQLPAGVTFMPPPITSHGRYDDQSGLWTINNLASGEQAMLGLTAQVDTCTNGRTITNTARVISASSFDPIVGRNEGNAVIRVGLGIRCYIYFPFIIYDNPCAPINVVDKFNSDLSGWPEDDKALLKTEYTANGEYRMLTKATGVHFATRLPDYFTDFEAQIDASWAATEFTGKAYGIVFGLASDNSYAYLYQINADRRQYRLLRRYSNNNWEILYDKSSDKGWVTHNAIWDNPLAANQIKVIRSGTVITLCVNNVFLGAVTDSSIPSGQVGLSIERYDDDPDFGTRNAEALFDNYGFSSEEKMIISSNSKLSPHLQIGTLPSTD